MTLSAIKPLFARLNFFKYFSLTQIIYFNIYRLLVKISEIKLDNFYNLQHSDLYLYALCYIHNVSAFFRIFLPNLGSYTEF